MPIKKSIQRVYIEAQTKDGEVGRKEGRRNIGEEKSIAIKAMIFIYLLSALFSLAI